MEEEEKKSEGEIIKEERKNKRLFGLFLVLDIIVLILIVIEIIVLAQ